MIVLKKVGGYLKSQISPKRIVNKRNPLMLFFICLFFFIVGFFINFLWFFSFIFLILSLIFLLNPKKLVIINKKSLNYQKGIQGERLVAKTLYDNLDNNYYLLNDVHIPNLRSNIDHIVLGPNGIFLIETKNWQGNIFCVGDDWRMLSGDRFSISPSKFIKKASVELKNLINSKQKFKKAIWIERLIVFTNEKVYLNLEQKKVPVLKINELVGFIKTFSKIHYIQEELREIANIILNQ